MHPPVSAIIVGVIRLSDLDHLETTGLVLSSGDLLRLQAFSQKRHQEFVAGRWLLQELLKQYWHYNSLPEIVYTTNGRPYFKSMGLLDFSISHSGDYIMVAISDVGRIGLDVEVPRILPQYLSVIQRRFSLAEIDYINQMTISEQKALFWRFWTIRESLLKLNGLSVLKMQAIALFPQQLGIHTDFADYSTVMSFEHPHYVWALAIQSAVGRRVYPLIKMLHVSANKNKIIIKNIMPLQLIRWQHIS